MPDREMVLARELAVNYDLHCEAIDDPDPEWLIAEVAALLVEVRAEAKLDGAMEVWRGPLPKQNEIVKRLQSEYAARKQAGTEKERT